MIIKVSNLNDSGEGSFRNAIIHANKSCKLTIITFTINGVITLNSSLPHIEQRVIISSLKLNNDNTIDYNNLTLPIVKIEIDCNKHNGLILTKQSAHSMIIGLSITNSKSNGLEIHTDKNFVHALFLGITINGNRKGNRKNGLYITSNHNIIGTNPTKDSNFVSNIISGNYENGILLKNASENRIVKCKIGTNIIGDKAIPNFKNGILLINSHKNIIGGKVSINSDSVVSNPTGNKSRDIRTFIIPPLGNLISGNKQNGVMSYKSSENILMGNFIGTDFNGNHCLGNHENGIFIYKSHNNRIQGCTFHDEPFIYYNVVSGNIKNGLCIKDSNYVIVHGNFFGLAASLLFACPNKLDGILVEGTCNEITIGGVIPLGNTCSGNIKNGIHVKDNVSNFTSFNTFGGLGPFAGVIPNGENGILFEANGINNNIRTNVFSGNLLNGIVIKNCNGISINSNIVGMNTDGSYYMMNGKNGLLIEGNSKNIVVNNDALSIIRYSAYSYNKECGILIKDNAENIQINDINLGMNTFSTKNTLNNNLAVSLKDNCKNISIVNCYVSGNIFIDNHVSHVKITDNNFGINRFDDKIGKVCVINNSNSTTIKHNKN